MKRQSLLKYVHWFGYLTTLIVVIQLLFLSYIGIAEWRKREERREATQMHRGPATERLRTLYGGEADAKLLNRLPRLETLKPDGFRFLASPSFNDMDFAIAVRRTSSGGDGVLLMAPRNAVGKVNQPLPFRLSVSDYDTLSSDLDELAEEWEGEAGWWTDGTGVVLERVRNNEVISGFGNSPNFYGKISARVFAAVQPLVPQLADLDGSWHPKNR